MTEARRSLFWTIAGIFLLTLVVGTLFQVLIAVAVLRPLEAREARARAEWVSATLAAEIATHPDLERGAPLDTLLARQRPRLESRGTSIVYRRPDGETHIAPADRARLLPDMLADPAVSGVPPARPPGAPATSAGPARPPRRFEVLARHTVTRGPAAVGEILILRPDRPRGGSDLVRSRTVLLFLPVALMVSVIGGLGMVRMLVGRLRALERLATRVTEGDLTVRIADRSGDEIGRLAERLDRMTDHLAEARDRLEATERQRRQLFADITHELATPLTSIRGYAETLLDPSVPMASDERTRYVRGVLDESRRLDRLIRDLFELARLEAGATPIEKEPLDWVALCRNTLERFEPRFRDAGLEVAWRDSAREAWIEADGRKIEEVLENLMTNALRYVPRGGRVVLWIEPYEGGFRLRVCDDGPGISAGDLPLLFERFYRGDGAARSDAGSGLGLAIVREIVERHGGAVRAEPRMPHGLTIVIELPGVSPGVA